MQQIVMNLIGGIQIFSPTEKHGTDASLADRLWHDQVTAAFRRVSQFVGGLRNKASLICFATAG
jgi:hypothetical protein